MIPTFESQTAMINYFKTLEGKNFDVLLEDEFNIPVPIGVPKYQPEYLYKYLIQGMSFNKLSGDDLIKYAVERTENLVKLQPHIKVKGTDTPIESVMRPGAKTKKSGGKRQKHFGADGEIKYVEHRKMYIGFWGNKVVVTKAKREAVELFLKQNYQS